MSCFISDESMRKTKTWAVTLLAFVRSPCMKLSLLLKLSFMKSSAPTHHLLLHPTSNYWLYLTEVGVVTMVYVLTKAVSFSQSSRITYTTHWQKTSNRLHCHAWWMHLPACQQCLWETAGVNNPIYFCLIISAGCIFRKEKYTSNFFVKESSTFN